MARTPKNSNGTAPAPAASTTAAEMADYQAFLAWKNVQTAAAAPAAEAPKAEPKPATGAEKAHVKGLPGHIVCSLATPDGKHLWDARSVPTKAFKTGSSGYWDGGKVEINGRKFQVQVQLVEIKSKGS